MTVQAEVSLGSGTAAPLGRDRIRLLEALGREGSIAGAARAVGITYKTAWDAVFAMNNLFGTPLVDARSGGQRGGGAHLTADGRRVIGLFHRLDRAFARSFAALEAELAGTGIALDTVTPGLMLRTSARNALRGQVVAVTEDRLHAEVALALPGGQALITVVTRDSARELHLVPGRPASALVKASFVILAPTADDGHTSARNRLHGVVARRADGPVNSEVTLDLGGTPLTAVVTRHSADALGLAPGRPATALIDAAHIVLAVDWPFLPLEEPA